MLLFSKKLNAAANGGKGIPEVELVLVAEDNPDDATLLRRAVERAELPVRLKIVSDGEQVVLYLQGLGAFANREMNPKPSLIILDLKMPRKNGFEVLEWLKENPEFAAIPKVVMSASGLETDVRRAYDLGANTYFIKPGTFHDLVETMRSLQSYWSKAQK